MLLTEDFDANIKISAAKYSKTAARKTGAELVTIALEYPKLRRNFSAIEGGKIIPALHCREPPFDVSELNVSTDLTPSLIELAAKSPEKRTLTALETSLSDIVFFLAISVKRATIKEISRAIIHNALLSCCLELEVIPFLLDTCFNILEI